MVDRISRRLGNYLVNVEIPPEVISSFVDEAVSMAEPYIGDTSFITVVADKVVDLSGQGIVDVVRVFHNQAYISDYDELDLFHVRDYSNFYDRAILPYRISQMEDYIDRSFKYDKETEKLYLDDYSGTVTIEVIKKLTVEQIKDEEMRNWIQRYALALCKESLGRVRGKYRLNNAPFELDSQELLQEAQEELRNLEDDIEQKGKGFYFVTR